jgi:hypothetical protein
MVAPDGALPLAGLTALEQMEGCVTNAIAGESSRWVTGCSHQYQNAPYPFYKWNVDWVAEHTRLTGTYFPAHEHRPHATPHAGLYPAQNAPQFRTTRRAQCSQASARGGLFVEDGVSVCRRRAR